MDRTDVGDLEIGELSLSGRACPPIPNGGSLRGTGLVAVIAVVGDLGAGVDNAADAGCRDGQAKLDAKRLGNDCQAELLGGDGCEYTDSEAAVPS